MLTVLLMVLVFAGYLVAYHTYGRYLAKKIFKVRADAEVPSRARQDGVDFVPTKKGVIFGHHFTSIAGTGPIVGPAIGVIWGWVPALIWVFFGSIFMGAVHDLGSLVVSLRNQGRSISDITAQYLNRRCQTAFFLIVFFALLIVLAIFGLVIASIFAMYPQSVFPVWMEIPIAILLGWLIYKRSANLKLATLGAVVAMYVTVVIGHYMPISMPDLGASTDPGATALLPATGVWTIVLLIYAFFASTMKVTTLLQPRDYINAWQLYIAMGLLVAGALASGFGPGLDIVAPAVNLDPEGAPPIVPFLFITIACGAISGFHSLVSSGTTAKQISSETDAQFVGFGSMLVEGLLAVLVIIAVSAGIGMAYDHGGEILRGSDAWNAHYASWTASKGLGSKITAVVVGSANMIATLGIPAALGIVIMGVFIASFAGTTLDSATRIQRYIVAEIFSNLKLPAMTNRYAATAFVVITAGALAFAAGADGKGALVLWPMFGSVNQLLACLALLVISFYLVGRGGRGYLFTLIPCFFMLVMTSWSLITLEIGFIQDGQTLLLVINGVIMVLGFWMLGEGLLLLFRRQRATPAVDSAGAG